MNEEQRKAGTLDVLSRRNDKEKDYSKYFEHVYQPPNLKEAKKRGKEEVAYNRDFQIDEKYRGMGKGRSFLIKTYGCQMNAHDTEVMAGIFTALGYTPTEDVNEADVILLNTCAIRENAENKVFGEIGNLKHIKQKRPDCLIGVCGCMSQEEYVVN
ncbi:tRNA (N6-isopentenyl adenosine(37)-C2)-methylthiotransferase MiaB, partial [Staphylococcus equorum]